jgi:hypothetical protein
VLQAGVVHEDVDGEVEPADGVEVGQVDRGGRAAHVGGHRLRRLGVPVEDDDLRAVRGQPDGAGPPDARGAAGDQCAPPGERTCDVHGRDGRPPE